jgi:hypothetical protein
MFNNACRKSCCLLENVGKYGRDRQAVDENVEQCMRFVCQIPNVIDPYSDYVILIFSLQQWLH